MRPDNDLLRTARQLLAAEKALSLPELANRRRLAAWRERYFGRFGHYPAQAVTFAPTRRAELPRPIHTNSNVVRMPRRRKQYMHANLPTGPEAA